LLRTDWSVIHENTGFSYYTLPLAIMSFLYGVGVNTRISLLKNRGKQLPGFVVSVGNITAGGTGKTPVVLMLSRWAKKQGYNVAVLSRGYGGSYSNESDIVTDGKDILLSPDISGDEPWLIANTLNGVPVIVSKNRYLGGIRAHKSFGSNFFILDDGFQHILLKRDMDIVLADAKKPFGNGHLLPWGPLREPLSGLKRADAFVFTRSGDQPSDHGESYFNNKPVFRGDHVPDKIILPNKGKEYEPSFIDGKRVIAFSGIGRPASFKESLVNLGAKVVSFKAFGDHYPFSERDMLKIQEDQKTFDGDLLITTEKDWVRIREKASNIDSIAYLTIDFVIKSGEENFYKMIKTKADAALKNL